jgi:hypothetical protein
LGRFPTFSVFLFSYQTRLKDARDPPCQTCDTDLFWMITADVETPFCLLAAWERSDTDLQCRLHVGPDDPARYLRAEVFKRGAGISASRWKLGSIHPAQSHGYSVHYLHGHSLTA